ncbi:MAG TPA: tetratricopeptide repeat protein [Blastocatellia bacterium]|nr:tetratricopeptide repeat protein [Blastocatellia bacterium]
MKIKNLLSALAGCVLFSLLTISAFAQVGRIEGDVLKAGTTEPIVGAEVQIIRTDIKGNYPVKSDKKGHFLHAGVPFVGTYTILVSAEGCEPAFFTSVRPDKEPLKIELRAGDGRKLTLEDTKKAAGGNTAGGPAAAPKVSEADKKKADEEYKKALAEREEAEKYNASIAVINLKLKEGNDAMAKNDFAAAITAFKEAVTANPTIHISQGNLAIALQKRAVKQFNEGNRDAAKQDFLDSVAASNKALEGLDAAEKDTKIKSDPVQNKSNRRTYLVVRAESEAILGGKYFDGPQAEAAVKDYNAVAELTDDPAKKKDFPIKGARVLFDAGQTDSAIAAYQKILDADPTNIEAWHGIGLAYANAGKFKESADSLQTFVEKAPATDPRVAEAKTVIAELVRGNNLPPPKSLDDGKKKGAAPAKKKP